MDYSLVLEGQEMVLELLLNYPGRLQCFVVGVISYVIGIVNLSINIQSSHTLIPFFHVLLSRILAIPLEIGWEWEPISNYSSCPKPINARSTTPNRYTLSSSMGKLQQSNIHLCIYTTGIQTGGTSDTKAKRRYTLIWTQANPPAGPRRKHRDRDFTHV